MAFRNPITRLSQLVADTITGAFIRTAATAPNVSVYQDDANGWGVVEFATGDPTETVPGTITVDDTADPGGGADIPFMRIQSPTFNSGIGGNRFARVDLDGGDEAGFLPASVRLWPSVIIGTNGNARRIRALDFGSYNDTTDASSSITVSHDCGFQPDTVVTTGSTSGTGTRARVTGRTTTTFTLTFRNSATNVDVGAGVAVSGFWVALA